eukprot:750554-Hanusia_phi.AAC.1
MMASSPRNGRPSTQVIRSRTHAHTQSKEKPGKRPRAQLGKLRGAGLHTEQPGHVGPPGVSEAGCTGP